MSDFWDKNKGSIKSGLLTAGKYSYQGTKYVAKTGYQAGKSQYQTNKKNRKNGGAKGNGNDDEEEFDRGEPAPITRLNDPKSFPAPPLRQGQNQYAGNGQYVSADTAPLSNTPTAMQTPNQQMNQYQGQPQQGYFDPQYSNNGTPSTLSNVQQQPIQQQPGYQQTIPQQSGFQPSGQQVIQQQPIQPQTLPQQGYQQTQQQPTQLTNEIYQQQQQQPIQQHSIPQQPIELTEQGYQRPNQQQLMQQQPAQSTEQGYQQPIQQQPVQQQPVQQQPVPQQQDYQQPIPQLSMQQQPIQLAGQGYQQPVQQQGYQLPPQQPTQQQPMQQQLMQQPVPQQQEYQQPPQQQPMQSSEPAYQQPMQQQITQQQPLQQQPISLTDQGYQQQQMQQPPRLQPAIPGRVQPQIPSRPEIPSRTQPNIPENTMSSGSFESVPAPSNVGPHFEVKPFNREEYEEAKKHKATIVPEIDPSSIAPPPKHRDRSSESSKSNSPRVNPSYPRNTSVSSMPKRGVPTPSGATPSKNTDSGANKDVSSSVVVGDGLNQEEQSEKPEDEAGSSINGLYQEPTTSFAPPPKPHRNVDTNGNAPRTSNYPHNSSAGSNINIPPRGHQPPPVLPKRGTGGSLGAGGSNVELEQTTTTPDQVNGEANEISNNNSISGAYAEHTVNFQPPPKPFRRPGEGPQDRNLSKKSTSTSYSSNHSPGLPTRGNITEIPPQSGTGNGDVKTGTNTELPGTSGQPVNQPMTHFPPPPKPFKLKTEELPTKLNADIQNVESRGKPEAEGVGYKQGFAPQLPPHSDASNAPDYDELEGATRPIDYLASQSKASSNESVPNTNNFFQDLNASISSLSLQDSRKSKAAPPPVVKPKPKSLSHISLDNTSSPSSFNDITKKNKKPPPVVKPKPKNINNIYNGYGSSTSTASNTPNTGASTKSPGMVPIQPPSRGSSRTQIPIHRAKPPVPPPLGNIQIPTNRRSKMPLPHETNKNRDSAGYNDNEDDVNPFLIYKKDAVPSSNDRMHNNT